MGSNPFLGHEHHEGAPIRCEHPAEPDDRPGT